MRDGTLLREEKSGCCSAVSSLDSIRPIRDDGAMTKVNERAYVPEIDDAARERLGEALDKEGVVAAMLIGSQARGDTSPSPSMDIAIWHEPTLSPEECLDLQLSLKGAASEALGTEEAGVVALNQASLLIQYRSIRDGVRLIERNHAQRVRFETRAIVEFLDFKPVLERFAQHRLD
jgi:predicted nucleotidyltransferase